MTIRLTDLNENQRLAVEWDDGNLLVLAGPGSGKTYVLTLRVARLLQASPSSQFRVLGLTFTNKAAAEMRSRVEEAVPDCSERFVLTTFHSFCADLLRQHGSHVRLAPDFAILTQEADRKAVLAEAVTALVQRGEDVGMADVRLLPIIDRLLGEGIEPSETTRLTGDQAFVRKLAALYGEYEAQLVRNSRLDFGSLLLWGYRLLQRQPIIAQQFRRVFPHVCVDEFQDTNRIQYLLLKLICGDSPRSLFVVADDDQIIYQWRGASPARLRELCDDYQMTVVQLPASYRCPPEVVRLANALIGHNLDRTADKAPLYAVKKPAGEAAVVFREFDTVAEELRWVAADIYARHRDSPGCCAVLARTRRVLDEAVTHIRAANLKAFVAMRRYEFESAPLRFLHGILRLANSRGDIDHLSRVCKAFYELEGGELEVEEVRSAAPRFADDYLRAWSELVRGQCALSKSAISFLADDLPLLTDHLDFLSVIRSAMRWFEDKNAALSSRDEEGFTGFADEKAAWQAFQAQAQRNRGFHGLTLNAFLHELDLTDKAPPAPSDAVPCLTIHSAKGLEFEHVYLVGLVEGQLPSYQSIQKGPSSREMQEERRNCFVAITRSQAALTLTYASRYFGWPKTPSRFLKEMGVLM